MGSKNLRRSHRASKPLSLADLLDLLQKAHKRQTAGNRWLYRPVGEWDRTASQLYAFQALCSAVNDVVLHRRYQHPPPEAEGLSELIRQGQQAVNELRRVLPCYIAHLQTEMERGPNALLGLGQDRACFEREWKFRQAQTIQGYEHMRSCLFDFQPRNHQYRIDTIWRKLTSWETGAIAIYELFEDFVGKATSSRNGPAVQFIGVILELAGTPKEKSAIEQMLRRYKTNMARKIATANAAESV